MPNVSQVQIFGGGFTDALGNVVSGGQLVLELSSDCATLPAAIQYCAGTTVSATLDNTGSVPLANNVYVAANDLLNPTGSFYTASVYSSTGELVWGPQYVQILSTTSPFNLDAWVPIAAQPVTVVVNSALASSAAPAHSNSAGTPGTIAYDATHIYVCVAANTWVRATLAGGF